MLAGEDIVGGLGWGWRSGSWFTHVAAGWGSHRQLECPHDMAVGFPGEAAMEEVQHLSPHSIHWKQVTKASPHSREGRTIREAHATM